MLQQDQWETFVNSFKKSSPLGKARQGINEIKSQKTSQVAHPSPYGKANELINLYAKVSSYEFLNDGSIASLRDTYSKRGNLTDFMPWQMDDCDANITQCEPDTVLAKGKSTAPGIDGITYDVIKSIRKLEIMQNRALRIISGCPKKTQKC